MRERGGLRAVGESGAEPRFAFREPAKFTAAEQQVERNADPGDKHDDEEPGERVRGRALFAHEPRDQENREREAGDGEQRRDDAVGEEVLSNNSQGFEHAARREKLALPAWQGRGKKSLPSGSGLTTFRAPCLVGYSSGQRGQTVNLLGSALHWFESSSYHHFTSLAGRDAADRADY